MAYLFAKQLSRLLHGNCQIGFCGIPQLDIPAHKPYLLVAEYNYIDQDSTYPWLKSEPLWQTIIRRVASSGVARLKQRVTKPLATEINKAYSRYLLSSNTPNLYHIRSASVGRNLLVDVASAVCNIGYLPSRCEASSLIPGQSQYRAAAKEFIYIKGNNSLYVHIRAGDILAAKNSLYKTLPIDTIKQAKDKLNTRLVFIGQLQESDYSRALRQAFPDDDFFYSGSESFDFEIIRASAQVLLSTSTFAWLAAWISESNHTIFLPNIGLFNQSDAPAINLVDSQDKRFKYLK